jgi:hypothetical protein
MGHQLFYKRGSKYDIYVKNVLKYFRWLNKSLIKIKHSIGYGYFDDC